MTEPRYSRDRWLEEQLTISIRGEETINAVTRDNAEAAYLIGAHIKTAYELGLEYTSRLVEHLDHDRHTQWEIGKVALECLDTANQRAANKADELGVI